MHDESDAEAAEFRLGPLGHLRQQAGGVLELLSHPCRDHGEAWFEKLPQDRVLGLQRTNLRLTILDGLEDGRRSCAILDSRDEVLELLFGSCLVALDRLALLWSLVVEGIQRRGELVRNIGHGVRTEQFGLKAGQQGGVGHGRSDRQTVRAGTRPVVRAPLTTVRSCVEEVQGVQ